MNLQANNVLDIAYNLPAVESKIEVEVGVGVGVADSLILLVNLLAHW